MSHFPPYSTALDIIWHYFFRVFCAAILGFLICPILVIIPLSFNIEPYFTYPIPGYSLRWYQSIIDNEMWMFSVKNSFIVGTCTTLLSVSLGTVAALGLSRSDLPYKRLIMAVLISPMIVPVVITGVGMYFFFSRLNLTQSLFGLILAHSVLATPFVVITVTATLTGFDRTLSRAAASLGASPIRSFFKVTMPLILPGMISGGLFAFITSFDELVVTLFLGGVEQRTIPRQMWAGIREQISPSILAIATILTFLSIFILTTLEWLRRRSQKIA
jgi:putative spermidine/putrescine transport system permease protein